MRFTLPKTPLLVGAALTLSVSCAGEFDDTRKKTEPTGTLGDELYSALCDRVGASALREDLYGASYHGVCHRDASGQYADLVDQSKLPGNISGGAALARVLAIAKVEAMGRRRAELIAALNATFRDDPLADPTNPSKAVRGHEALKIFLQKIVPLYEKNPVDTEGSGAEEALMPSVTRATGRLFASVAGPGKDPESEIGDPVKAQAAREALARLSGRLGYRPLRVALGAMRPSLAYPDLRPLTQTFAPRLGPGGLMREAFQNVLGMTQSELDTSLTKTLPPPYQLVNPATLQPNRPRSNLEVARAIMLSTSPSFAAPGAQPRYLVVRDGRGYAVPAGNLPGSPGTVPSPFADADSDGFADVDATGRFLGPGSSVALIDSPFLVPGLPRQLPPDAYGRALGAAGTPLYEYVDTSQAFVAANLRDFEPLLDPDPAKESEALADLLSGAFALYGDPIQNTAPWAMGGAYPSFDTSQSPLVDLLHATGWMFAHKSSDVHLKFVKKLFTDHEQIMARVIGASLKVREISNAHPEAALDPSVTIWDELQEIVVRTGKDPALFKDVLRALAHPDTQAYLGPAFGKYAQFKDALTYDTDTINGPPVNLTDPSNPEPHVPPDYSQPDVGENRSGFHRIMQIIHDVNDVNACNKPGAKVTALGITMPGTYDECELFFFQNMGIFYLRSILHTYGAVKPQTYELKIRSTFLNLLLTLGGLLGLDADGVFEDGSGITGMTRKPSPEALNRLVFFGAETDQFDPLFGGAMPDRDLYFNGKNQKTNDFVKQLVNAVSSSVCPERLAPVPGCTAGEPCELWLADCGMADPNDLLRMRDKGTIFLWEKNDFYKGMAPVLGAFEAHDAGQVFLDSIEALYRHWPTDQHGPECNSNGNFVDLPWKKYLSDSALAAHQVNPAYNAKWCNGSGVARYEPVLAEAFASDLLPALGELVKVLDDPNFVVDDRNGVTKSGLDVLHEMTVAMMDADYAASVGMTDRFGNKTALWSNGLIGKPQLSMYDLFANALAKIDQRLPEGTSRRVRWKRARSKLVDQFLTVDGEGPNAQFRNQGFAKSVPILLDVIREQINANCPDRETSPVACPWATTDFAMKAADTIDDPAFSTVMFLLDLINEDEEARRALEKHLRYLVQEASQNDALVSMLASSADMMQVLGDDLNMPLIYNAFSLAAAPEAAAVDGKLVPGTADRVLELMDALTREGAAGGEPALNPYDPYRVLDSILVNLVSPVDPSDPESFTPLEIFLDTIAEVNRLDAAKPREEPLSPDDLQAVFATLRDFMASRTRGMEQFYEIVRHRNGE